MTHITYNIVDNENYNKHLTYITYNIVNSNYRM